MAAAGAVLLVVVPSVDTAYSVAAAVVAEATREAGRTVDAAAGTECIERPGSVELPVGAPLPVVDGYVGVAWVVGVMIG